MEWAQTTACAISVPQTEGSKTPTAQNGATTAQGSKAFTITHQLNKWMAQIQKNKKKYHLGYFATAEEAAAAYDAASR